MKTKLKTYSAHVKQKNGYNTHKVELIVEGFNWYAFMFMGFWAIYKRCWSLLGITIIVNIVLNYITNANMVSQFAGLITSGVFMIWVGFSANDFLRKRLHNDGFDVIDIVTGETRARAEQRFFDRNSHIFPNVD